MRKVLTFVAFAVAVAGAKSALAAKAEDDGGGGGHGHATFTVTVPAKDAHDAKHILDEAIVEKYGRASVDEHHEGAPLHPKADLAGWSLVVFLVFVFVLWKFAWGPLQAGLDKREASIRKDIVDAENARQQAEKMLADHRAQLDKVQDEVREIIAEARSDAERTKQDIVTQAQTEAQATQQRAVEAIERAKDQALDELFSTMADQVAQATEYVVGRSLAGDDQNRLIDEALAQFAGQSE